VSKNFVGYRSENNFIKLSNYYVERSSTLSNAAVLTF